MNKAGDGSAKLSLQKTRFLRYAKERNRSSRFDEVCDCSEQALTPSNWNVSEHTLETGDVLEPLAPPLNYLQNSRSLTRHISTPERDDMILR